jgi:hypothetical protein
MLFVEKGSSSSLTMMLKSQEKKAKTMLTSIKRMLSRCFCSQMRLKEQDPQNSQRRGFHVYFSFIGSFYYFSSWI